MPQHDRAVLKQPEPPPSTSSEVCGKPGGEKKFRGDLPRPQPSAGGSLQGALESAKPENRENTLHRYQQDVWANSSRASQDARLRTLEAVAAAWGISLAPVSKDVVKKIAAALKMGGYRSVRQYFSRLCRLHVELTNSELSAEAELELKDAVRSVERGMGGAALKDSFELESLFHKGKEFSALEQAIIVLGSWFLLREIELVALRRGHLFLDEGKEQVLELKVRRVPRPFASPSLCGSWRLHGVIRKQSWSSLSRMLCRATNKMSARSRQSCPRQQLSRTPPIWASYRGLAVGGREFRGRNSPTNG